MDCLLQRVPSGSTRIFSSCFSILWHVAFFVALYFLFKYVIGFVMEVKKVMSRQQEEFYNCKRLLQHEFGRLHQSPLSCRPPSQRHNAGTDRPTNREDTSIILEHSNSVAVSPFTADPSDAIKEDSERGNENGSPSPETNAHNQTNVISTPIQYALSSSDDNEKLS